MRALRQRPLEFMHEFAVTAVLQRIALVFALAVALAFAHALAFAPPAVAQEDDEEESEFAREGWYFAAAGVYLSEQWDGAISDIGAEDTWALDFRAGRRVSPWAAAEVALEVTGDQFPDERQDFSIVHAAVNARAYPFGGRFDRIQPFGLVGVGIVSTVVDRRDRSTDLRQSNADWGFRGGVGVDVYVTGNWAVSAQGSYVWTVGDVKNVDYVSAGLGILYRF